MPKRKKYNFYGKAIEILRKGATYEDVLELAADYSLTEEEANTYVDKIKKGRAEGEAKKQGESQIDNDFLQADDDFINLMYPTLHVFSREDNREFYIYNKGKYERVSDGDMQTLVDSFFEDQNYFKYRRKSNDVRDFIKRVGLRLSRTPGRNWNEEKVEQQKWYINCINGLLDIDTLELKPHTHSYFSTVQIPHPFDPKATCPEFQKYLDTIGTNDPDTCIMLQEMFGYNLSDGNPRHKVFYMYGMTARNGKSTAGKILTGLVGLGNTSALSIEQLAKGKAITSLVGKQLNFSDEISTKYVESNTLTSLSAEGYVQIDPKYKTPYMHKVKTKFIVACNTIPRFGDEQGMKHRMIPIPFTYQIPEQERILDYHKILLDKEGSGILNWAIEGYKRVKKNNEFFMSERALQDLEDNVHESNSVYAFLEDEYEFGEEYEKDWITVSQLYGDTRSAVSDPESMSGYNLYCAKSGIKPLSKKKFSSQLQKFAEETGKIESSRRSNGVGYKNLREKSWC